jgi:hypothetical protein
MDLKEIRYENVERIHLRQDRIQREGLYEHNELQGSFKGASTLLVLVLVGRLVWLLLVLVNLRPHYFSCSPGFGA